MRKLAFLLPLCLASVYSLHAAAKTPSSERMLEQSEKIHFYARLSPVHDIASHGSGVMTGYYDFYTHEVYWKLAYQNLSSRVIYAKIHGPSHPGHNAPVILPLQAPYTTPIIGIATVTGKISAEITGGYAYVVVSTEKYPKGELRGRINRSIP